MAHMFKFKNKIYSVSDKNDKGEYVVVRFTKSGKVEEARIVKAGSEAYVEKMVKMKPFESFKVLDGTQTK